MILLLVYIIYKRRFIWSGKIIKQKIKLADQEIDSRSCVLSSKGDQLINTMALKVLPIRETLNVHRFIKFKLALTVSQKRKIHIKLGGPTSFLFLFIKCLHFSPHLSDSVQFTTQ